MDTKLVAGLVVAGVLLICWLHHPSTFVADGTDPGWDWAVQQSESKKLPTVVLFTADWCPGCQALHANVLSRSDIWDELHQHYIFHTVNINDARPQVRAHAQKLGISVIPTLIRYDANQKETDRTHNMTAEQMMEWLKAGE